MGNHKRFFVPNIDCHQNQIRISDDLCHQLSRVLRLTIDDEIILFDSTEKEFVVKIISITKNEILAQLIEELHTNIEPKIHLTLAISLPKNDKIDSIIQRTTELGVCKLIVCRTERTIIKIDSSKIENKISRWQKIATESAEQCGRTKIPSIKGILEFSDLIKCFDDYDLVLFAWEENNSTPLNNILITNPNAKKILLVVGPEGGFSKKEADEALQSGAKIVNLGRRIMRVETAAIASCAAIFYQYDWQT